MGLVDWQNGTPLLWAAAVTAGVGVAALVRLTGRLAWVAGGAVTALCVLPAAAMSIPAASAARTSDAPRAWAEAGLDEVGAGGVVVVHADSLAAVGSFVTQVEGARPDVGFLIEQRVGDVETTRAALASAGMAELVAALDGGGGATGPMWAALGAGARPLAWQIGGTGALPPARQLIAGAPLATLVSADAARDPDDLATAARRITGLLGATPAPIATPAARWRSS